MPAMQSIAMRLTGLRCIEHCARLGPADRHLHMHLQRAAMLQADFVIVFNKWMLDKIVRQDGCVMRLHRGGHYSMLALS